MRFFLACVVCLLSVAVHAHPAAPESAGAWMLQGHANREAETGKFRLTPAQPNSLGTAIQAAEPFSASGGLVLSFSYVTWGGGDFACDGMSVFLFDAGKDMAGARPGGGLGYCQGANS